MIIECIGSPFTYRWPTGEVRLIPGQPVELPDSRVARLFEKAPGRVQVLESTMINADLTGHIIAWNSPLLWGEMRARVLEDLGHGVRVFHPMTEVECVIPTTWIKESR